MIFKNMPLRAAMILFCRSVLTVTLLSSLPSFGETEGELPPSLHPGDISLTFIQERKIKDAVPEALVQIESSTGYFSKYAFVVDKSARSLSIWQQESETWKRVGHFPTDMGKKGGDKTVTGDHRTPEGIYFLEKRFEGKTLDYNLYGSRAFATNYPNLYDRREGKTGSGIWLHAVPDSTPLTRGSRGCVVVRDQIIKKVTPYIHLGKTPLIIKEAVKYLSPNEWQNRKENLLQWLAQWKEAWKNQNVENYMDFYSKEDFKSRRMNWSLWKRYKSNVAKNTKIKEIQLNDPVIYTHNNEAIIKFLQYYKSSAVNDYGEKTLHLKKEPESQNWKIIAENWRRISKQQFEPRLEKREPTNVGSNSDFNKKTLKN